MNNSYLDYGNLFYLQRLMKNTPTQFHNRSIFMCGKGTFPTGPADSVFVVKETVNEKVDSYFFGISRCHNRWVCPVCEPIFMSKTSAEIAAAIDALKNKGQKAIMITFTIPHNASVRLEDQIAIGNKAWRHMIKHGQIGNGQYKACNADVMSDFRQAFNIKHFVRVAEVTYGDKRGWNYHFHALFWLDKKHFNSCVNWEVPLAKRWMRCLNLEARKLYKKKYGFSSKEATVEANKLYTESKRIEGMMAAYNRKGIEQAGCLFISKDKRGRPISQNSSHYISGWGSNSEMTGLNRKTSNFGDRMTPVQLLQSAKDGNKKHEQKYLELVYATKGVSRVVLSRSGLKSIIKEWQSAHPVEQTILKKKEIVCWLSKRQWCDLLVKEYCYDVDLRFEILKLALEQDCLRKIEDLLFEYGIDITNNKKHPYQDSIVA